MTGDNNEVFDAGEYWRNRVVSGSDLGVVGHRSVGHAYNVEIYGRRIEVLNQMLERHIDRPIEQYRILDIGCGSGFYTEYWQARGVKDYVGLDISSETIGHLSQRFPGYKFVNLDVTSDSIDSSELSGAFDLIMIFDVLFHIVDDRRFENVVRHVGSLIADDGRLFITDHLCPTRYQLSRHVVYRARESYLKRFADQNLALADAQLLFHYLMPPITGYRVIDYIAAAAFKVTGLIVSMSDRLATWTAVSIRNLDTRLRERGRRVSNNEMFVFEKNPMRNSE